MVHHHINLSDKLNCDSWKKSNLLRIAKQAAEKKSQTQDHIVRMAFCLAQLIEDVYFSSHSQDTSYKNEFIAYVPV